VIENGSSTAINAASIAKPSYLLDSVSSIIDDYRVDFGKISLTYLIIKGWLHARFPLSMLPLLFIFRGIFRLRRGMLFLDPSGDSLLAHYEAPTLFAAAEAE
jgi:hypothetical protein